MGHSVAKLARQIEARHPGLTIQTILSRLIRPTFVAPIGRMLVWADWSSVEGRMLPWLAKAPAANVKLDAYRAFDHGNGPDVYRAQASRYLNKAPDAITKDERQAYGKVPELALGFGGGKGAYLQMGRTYGVDVTETMAQDVVTGWRDTNPWAKTFWYALKDAAHTAVQAPETWQSAGRVDYVFVPGVMAKRVPAYKPGSDPKWPAASAPLSDGSGSLFCRLPCGRMLTYRGAHLREDENGRQVLWYRKLVSGGNVIWWRLWHGVLAENITQAAANSLLRVALRDFSDVVLHVHDEIVREVDEDRAYEDLRALCEVMTRGAPWSRGLPLRVEGEMGPYWTKGGDAVLTLHTGDLA